MRYMMIYKPDEKATKLNEAGVPPSIEHMTKMGKFQQDVTKEGVLLISDGLQQSSKGARVRHTGGKLTVTDGPFTETKELIAGFAIVDVKSKSDAIELAKRFLTVAGEGETEIRLMHVPTDFPQAHPQLSQAVEDLQR